MNNVSGKVRVDFRSDEPIYLQIARQVEEMVGNGELAVGDQLPTVREMAAELSINFNTVARAYRLLDELRIISTQRGRGTYIWEKPTDDARQIIKEEFLASLLRETIEKIEARGYTLDDVLEAMLRIKRDRGTLSSEQENE